MPTLTPEQIQALMAFLLPLMDQIIATKGGKFAQFAWQFIRPFLGNATPTEIAAAHEALPVAARIS